MQLFSETVLDGLVVGIRVAVHTGLDHSSYTLDEGVGYKIARGSLPRVRRCAIGLVAIVDHLVS